ncbi:MAG TPA: Fic family protein [Hyphomicrobiaceae bacterium]
MRLHHRFVLIHPFVNGNGRCTRLLADVVVKRLKAGRLTWGSAPLIEAGEARAAYTRALALFWEQLSASSIHGTRHSKHGEAMKIRPPPRNAHSRLRLTERCCRLRRPDCTRV